MKAKKHYNIALYLVVLLFTCCSNQKNYNKKEYMQYVLSESNGLKNTRIINGIKYTIQYLPAKFMAITENEKINADSIESCERSYSELEYVKLTVENAEGSKKNVLSFLNSPSQYNYFLQYANTKFNRSIELKVNDSVYPCVMSYMETGYKVVSKITFLVGFTKPRSENDYVVSFKDELFGNGIINFTIDSRDMKELKTIKFV